MERKKKSLYVICLDAFLIIGAIIFKIFYSDIMRFLPECFYASRGLPCGSCGGTRCIYNLLTGNIVEAFRLNQFFFIAFCYLGIIFILAHLAWVFGIKHTEKPLKVLANYKAVIVFGVGYLFFSVWRFF